MCGRFTQALSWQELHRLAGLIGQPRNLAPHYNLAPTDRIEVLRESDHGGVELIPMRWGLIPYWWKKPIKEAPATFNAGTDRLLDGPIWRDAYQKRRCVIPATGFYEWTGARADRTPHYFTAQSGEPLAFAALWDRWRSPEGEEILSASIIVGDADGWMEAYHDRQPVMLDWSASAEWMRAPAPPTPFTAPPPALREHVVSKRVNKAGANDDAELIAPVEAASRLF